MTVYQEGLGVTRWCAYSLVLLRDVAGKLEDDVAIGIVGQRWPDEEEDLEDEEKKR